MKLIVGLGNPGPKYEVTRHNAGFLMVDLLMDHFGGSWQGKKFDGEWGQADLFNEKCLFLKPTTFMNLSGKSVAKVMQFYKLKASDLIVIHDDIDQESGSVKAKEGGGHGGHNGIRSIIADTGQRDFNRIKIGVGRPKSQSKEEEGRQVQVSDWVLTPMSDAELLSYQGEVLDQVELRLKGIFDKAKKK